MKSIDITEPDLVNHPPHYNQGGVECIEALEACLPEAAFRGHLRGTAIKYLWRCNDKHSDPLVDIDKALWYINRLRNTYDVES